MSLNIQTNVRMPIKLKKEAEKMVKKGYYNSISELVVASVRNEVNKIKELNKATKEIELIRMARKQVWSEFLKKAHGNPKKASELMSKEAEKIYSKEPNFWD